MSQRRYMPLLSGIGWCSLGCTIVDHQPTLDGSGTDGPSDNDVCIAQLEILPELECPSGYEPYADYDGGGETVVLVDDPGAGVGLGLGLVVQFGGHAGADWVGYQVTENAKCRVGCRAPDCASGQYACYSIDSVTNGICAYYCSDEPIEQQACNEFHQSCIAGDPGTGSEGLDESGGGDDGVDESGGETTGGVVDEPYDCSQWRPEEVRQPIAGGAFHVPQALVDQLVQGSAEPLVECDGVRLRQGRDGYWVISKMRSGGLLGVLGLRVGDELRGLDDVELDSLDAMVRILGWFVTDDGRPRRTDAGHPGFSLRVRRDRRDFVRELRVVPSQTVSPSGHGGRP